MKKIIVPLLFIPMIISFIVSHALTANATVFDDNYANISSYNYESFALIDMLKLYDNEPKYLYIEGYVDHPTSTDVFYPTSWIIELGESATATYEENVLTLNTNTDSVYNLYYAQKNYNIPNDVTYNSVFVSTDNVRCSSINKVIIDYNTGSTQFYQDDTLRFNFGSATHVTHVESNIDGFPSLGLDIDVSFTPSLSGEVDRIVEQNGVQAESNYFSMTIDNNGSSNAQYMFSIVPTGSSINLSSSASNLNYGIDMETADGVYYYTCKEWVYGPTLNSGNLIGKSVTEYNQNSIWHVISSNSSATMSFNWAQINLTKDTSYDAVVIALPTEYTKPSRVFTIPTSDYYIDLSSAEEVYRSTFTVPNPVAYDSTNTEFGNTPNSGFIDVKNDSLVAEGYIDSNGETVIEDISFMDSVQAGMDYEAPTFSSDLSDLSLSDVSGLLQQTTGFFNFLATCFTWLPSWFWGIILFGLTAIVIIGVVKALL